MKMHISAWENVHENQSKVLWEEMIIVILWRKMKARKQELHVGSAKPKNSEALGTFFYSFQISCCLLHLNIDDMVRMNPYSYSSSL